MIRITLALLATCLIALLAGAAFAAERPEQAAPAWVWLEQDGEPAETLALRRSVPVRGMTAARLFLACDGPATVYLDGQEALRLEQPGTPQYKDVTPWLDRLGDRGQMVLAVKAEKAPGRPAGVLLRLDLESGWRKAVTVVSDSGWQAAVRPAKGWTAGSKPPGKWSAPQPVAMLGQAPWAQVTAAALAALAPLRTPTATPVENMIVPEDFRVELLHSVPKDQQGSWVSMCVDPRGRLIVCDQYGGLFRVTPPPPGKQQPLEIEKIDVDLGEAQGLLWAFDSLYVVVNKGQKYDSGLYRVTDSDGDDQLDKVETLRKLDGGSEHGPHAVLLTPDKQDLYVVCGNKTALTELSASRVPQVWDEDNLLPRPYGRGFMKGTRAPGGYICRVDRDGKNWELIATGFRNEYDAALSADGELFSYDADMEWDVNTPWYRPTRVCQVVSGVDYGWRNGGGKWPAHYPDTLPPVVNVGPGSPTGVAFGYGAKFPAKYQRALYLCDWSYGKLYAAHLTPDGAGYRATLEEFITGTPLPLTDLTVNPRDGALYFAIGGRRVQSGLYRVTYAGQKPTAPAPLRDQQGREARQLRRQLEELHLGDHGDAVGQAWPHLGHDDRFIRYAARVAVEHRPLEEWKDRALEETDPDRGLAALLALARRAERQDKGKQPDIDNPPPTYPAGDALRTPLHQGLAAALAKFDPQGLRHRQQVELLRVYAVTFARTGPPDEETRQRLIEKFGAWVPAKSVELNTLLAELLVYLQAPPAAEQVVGLLESAPTQEEQIHYAKSLRHLREGWTMDLRRRYLQWFVRAAGYRGGASFGLFVANIKKDAVAQLSPQQRERLAEVINAQPASDKPQVAPPRPFVKEWSMEEVLPLVENRLEGRDFDKGRQLFGAANCFACHRFAGEGGAVGPDLTALSGRFSRRDILESVLEPSKVISDQYSAVKVLTTDGDVVVGRIVNLAGDSLRINTDMLDPNKQVSVDRKQIERMEPSQVSMMPKGLLNTLAEEEILDLMAFLLSKGDRQNPMFQQ